MRWRAGPRRRSRKARAGSNSCRSFGFGRERARGPPAPASAEAGFSPAPRRPTEPAPTGPAAAPRNSAIVRVSPSLSGDRGDQPSTSCALEISGRRWRGSSCGSGRCTIREREPISSITCEASSRMVNSVGLPMLIGPVTCIGRCHQPHQPVDQIVDVAERARLRAVAIDRDVAPEQRLDDEVRHHASVVRMHARAVGVEDARDLDAHVVLTPVVEEQRLGAALALVVAGARSDRVDVAPIVFGLRMDAGIAVHFGGRRLEDFRAHALGQAQHVDRAVHAGLGRLHRIALVVNRRRRTGEIVDLVDLDIERKGHVVADQLEALVARAGARC